MPPAKTGGIFPKLGGAISPSAVNHPGEVEAGVTHQDFWTKQKYTTASGAQAPCYASWVNQHIEGDTRY